MHLRVFSEFLEVVTGLPEKKNGKLQFVFYCSSILIIMRRKQFISKVLPFVVPNVKFPAKKFLVALKSPLNHCQRVLTAKLFIHRG